MIALYDHIQELRAELRQPGLPRRERARIQDELAQALSEQAAHDRDLDAALADDHEDSG